MNMSSILPSTKMTQIHSKEPLAEKIKKLSLAKQISMYLHTLTVLKQPISIIYFCNVFPYL